MKTENQQYYYERICGNTESNIVKELEEWCNNGWEYLGESVFVGSTTQGGFVNTKREEVFSHTCYTIRIKIELVDFDGDTYTYL